MNGGMGGWIRRVRDLERRFGHKTKLIPVSLSASEEEVRELVQLAQADGCSKIIVVRHWMPGDEGQR